MADDDWTQILRDPPPDTSPIRGFRGAYFFLSNTWVGPGSEVWIDGILAPTTEHGYHMLKTLDIDYRRKIAAAPTPLEAKRLGGPARLKNLRPGWNSELRRQAMDFVVLQKFAIGRPLLPWLLRTGERHLEEANNWGDRFWGTVGGEGENNLGETLMRTRALRRAEMLRG